MRTRLNSQLSFSRSGVCRAFTLVEVIIASSLSSFVLAGVLSSFVMLGRTGSSISNYNVMALEARRVLEEFSQDTRMARAITWNSSSSVTLTVPNNYTANGNQVTYAYDSATSGATSKCFYRKPGDAAANTTRVILVRTVTNCTFNRFDRLDNAATTDAGTKRLELTLRISKTATGGAVATDNVVSACYLLRNKPSN
jgi:type II secretory pathway pseudopilin PulG